MASAPNCWGLDVRRRAEWVRDQIAVRFTHSKTKCDRVSRQAGAANLVYAIESIADWLRRPSGSPKRRIAKGDSTSLGSAIDRADVSAFIEGSNG